jgi:hypothetical protein
MKGGVFLVEKGGRGWKRVERGGKWWNAVCDDRKEEE